MYEYTYIYIYIERERDSNYVMILHRITPEAPRGSWPSAPGPSWRPWPSSPAQTILQQKLPSSWIPLGDHPLKLERYGED